jgi:hypothetical protein
MCSVNNAFQCHEYLSEIDVSVLRDPGAIIGFVTPRLLYPALRISLSFRYFESLDVFKSS